MIHPSSISKLINSTGNWKCVGPIDIKLHICRMGFLLAELISATHQAESVRKYFLLAEIKISKMGY